MNRIARLAASLILLLPLALSCTSTPTEIGEEFAAGWPREYSSLNKPWTRWWWMGNAVDRESLTATLEEFNRKGLGGVEISPVYGVEGYEERELDFLSPAWVDMLDHTIDEASRLGMGVDMIGGTGWPYGGPEVSREDAATRLVIKKYKSSAAHPWGSLKISSGNEKTGADPLLHLLAAGPDGERLDLTGKVDASGNLD